MPFRTADEKRQDAEYAGQRTRTLYVDVCLSDGTWEVRKVISNRTAAGNWSFSFQQRRHVLTPEGRLLQLVSYASGRSSWETSPVLRLSKEGNEGDNSEEHF